MNHCSYSDFCGYYLIADPPIVKVHPCVQAGMKYKIQENKDARFTCEASAFPDVTKLEWSR